MPHSVESYGTLLEDDGSLPPGHPEMIPNKGKERLPDLNVELQEEDDTLVRIDSHLVRLPDAKEVFHC
jgi:hypothetical protein